MCGIAGILSTTTTDLRAIQPMTERLRHRGPDSGALLFTSADTLPRLITSDAILSDAIPGTAALGHRRLSILDVSEHGLQPMQADSGNVWISYNGEVYNYLELRRELQAEGHHFSTGTDTEVILKAYLQWGTGCFERFNGMWALAILDLRTRTLVLSRDRFGIKPLYLNHSEGKLAFASEIKALLQQAKPKLNAASAKSMLEQHLVSHTNETFFQSIEAFPPAHHATIALDGTLAVIPQRYWDYPGGTIDPDDTNARTMFRELLESSIKLHMRSDVPVGSCLSGGLDSSSIVCFADKLLGRDQRPFHTFTARFKERSIDESPWVDDVNRQIAAHAHSVTPDANDFLADLDKVIWQQDEPFTSTSIYAQWCVMREARRAGIPVLLDGQGADEILCGYRKFYAHYISTLFKQKAWGTLIPEAFGLLIRGDRTFLRLSDALRYLPQSVRTDMQMLETLSTERYAGLAALPTPSLNAGGTSMARQTLDLTTFSLPALLRFEDRNSMAFSIESRVPFLDHRLVEFSLQLAPHHKMRRGTSKYVMREAVKDTIPASISRRRDKMGFGAPQKQWLEQGIVPAFLADIRNGNYAIAPLFKPDELTVLLNDCASNVPSGLSRLIFQLFILNRWAMRFQVDLSA